MSAVKEKKINKIKNKKIWPRIVAAVFGVVFMVSLTIGAITTTISSIILSRFTDLRNTAEGISDYFAENMNNEETCFKNLNGIMKYMGNLENIAIIYIDPKTGENEEYILKGDSYSVSVEVGLEEDGIDADGLDLTDERIKQALKEVMQSVFVNGKIFENNRINTVITSVNIGFSESHDDNSIIRISMKLNVYAADVMLLIGIISLNMIIIISIIVINIVSISKTVHEKKGLAKVYYFDPASGGKNMQYFYDRARLILKRKRNKYPEYAILDVRMQKYDSYCTCYGVERGMELIEILYNELSKSVNKYEVLAHSEKADFALLLGYTDKEELYNRIISITNGLKCASGDDNSKFNVGIYEVDDGNIDTECMYNFAGVALNSIAESEDGSICTYNTKMRDEELWVNMVENDMKHAMENGEFQVYLQPKYSTKEEKLSGAEALVRWIHPTRGFISPGRFVPIFEKNGFVLNLDDFMISEVAKQQAKWMSEGKELFPISVNVSRAHFTRADLAEHICGIVDKYGVPHDKIELELTESAFFDDKEVLIKTVKKLKEYGFEISMDDFGAGYSSLNSLKEMPLDVLKLDAEFFRGEDDENRGEVIVGEAITLAKKLNMRIVAEGIETREQVDSLARMDCDLIQGYYFAKPMPISEFEERAYGDNKNDIFEGNDK